MEETLRALEAALGCGIRSAAPVTDRRRGAAVYHVEHTHGQLALKTGPAAGREAAVLTALAELYPGYLLAAGEGWLALRWLTGPTTSELFAAGRADPAARPRALAAASELAAAVADLHAVGWRHGDLQPRHAHHEGLGAAQLIDFGIAHPPAGDLRTPPCPYRGGMAHFAAPELAATLAVTPADAGVPLTEAAEVYTLSAVLFYLAADRLPVDYAAVGLDRATASVADLHRVLAGGPTGDVRGDLAGWPELADLLTAGMNPDPTGRPAAADFRRLAALSA
ncbi:protein kinase family protein [Frankia nepalensis]|uniref:Protein kinase domain-containing protein n=1 Tax=Frankia nepalensis TaxID=1836974 RepID=A0A937R6E6_9ACTN|nr:hypothetical protein [Frankia nepalensis]MBL7496960.1 hypothetical protein [Frankia nepalensis]MBL7511339.1 hypothetical protein [Frankia nepalensis]MBL7626106.1 hypothetical protein [Frankia nepalensis]